MAIFNFDIVKYKNKLATLLQSLSSLIEEFVPQSSNVAVDAPVGTLVNEFV